MQVHKCHPGFVAFAVAAEDATGADVVTMGNTNFRCVKPLQLDLNQPMRVRTPPLHCSIVAVSSS